MAESVFCAQCGTAGRVGADFCGACGSALSKSEDTRSGSVIEPTPELAQAPVAPTAFASNGPEQTSQAEAAPVAPAAFASTGPEQTSQAEAAPVGGELTVFPWWQVIIFSIISSGVWPLYWFYCTRKQVSGLVETNRDDPGIQTFGWLVPIWQVWVVRDMWRDIDGVAQKARTEGINAQSYAMWFWICSYVWFVNYVGWIVVLVFYVITQSRLMAALKALNGGVTVNRRVTPWSAVWAFGPIALGVVVGVLTSL